MKSSSQRKKPNDKKSCEKKANYFFKLLFYHPWSRKYMAYLKLARIVSKKEVCHLLEEIPTMENIWSSKFKTLTMLAMTTPQSCIW